MKKLMFNPHDRGHSGFSLVELLVSAAIMSLVFGGLFASFQLMISVIRKSKAESGALALANERLEYIRSLPYNSVGTISGIPNGSIPQNSTTTLNGIIYNERVLVEYVDDVADGTGASDSNGIVADYKRVKVEYSWYIKNVPDSLSLISNIVPKGIETTSGGGTIRVNVFNASVQPVSGASVHLYNDTTTSTIDVTRYADINGSALFSGAPAAANYEITVTNSGYSTDQTYSASSSNPNPLPPHVAVLESLVSTMNFSIDQLSQLTILTKGVPTLGSFTDSFADNSKIATSSNIVLSSGAINLSGGAGSYSATGTIYTTTISPASMDSWSTLNFSASSSASTSVRVHLYSVIGTSTYTIVPDSDLAGNSVGFISGPVDISALNIVTYPSLALVGNLITTDINWTPHLNDWYLDYNITEPIIASVPFTLIGNKAIGTNASGTLVKKNSISHVTDSNGSKVIPNLEWDIYNVVLNTSAYDIVEACANLPISLAPNQVDTIKLTLTTGSTHSLRVRIENTSGNPIIGAQVILSRPSYSSTNDTSLCGQTLFSNLNKLNDYQLDISASGYSSQTLGGINVDGTTVTTIILSTP